MAKDHSMPFAPGEHPSNVHNILAFVREHPAAIPVLFRKILKRLKDGTGRYSEAENASWMRANSARSSEIAQTLSPQLWSEAETFGENARAHAKRILAAVPFDMGAGGDYQFLYWLTRYRKPTTIIETGVSAGWSSLAFLAGIKRNGCGRLYSSDFPFFRVRDPEKYIGILVPDELRAEWRLYTDGDEHALPRILSAVDKVDILHYDSDKSISGRRFAINNVAPRMAQNGIILMDDILDNSFFREYVETLDLPHGVLNERCGLIGSI